MRRMPNNTVHKFSTSLLFRKSHIGFRENGMDRKDKKRPFGNNEGGLRHHLSPTCSDVLSSQPLEILAPLRLPELPTAVISSLPQVTETILSRAVITAVGRTNEPSCSSDLDNDPSVAKRWGLPRISLEWRRPLDEQRLVLVNEPSICRSLGICDRRYHERIKFPWWMRLVLK